MNKFSKIQDKTPLMPEDLSAQSFDAMAEQFTKLLEKVENSTNSAPLLPEAYRLAEMTTKISDLRPFNTKVFAAIFKKSSKSQIKKIVDTLNNKNLDNILKDCNIASQAPAAVEICFNCLLSQVSTADDNDFWKLSSAVTGYLSFATDDELPKMIDQVNAQKSYPSFWEKIIAKYGQLYAQKPAVREKLWDTICQDANYGSLYANLTAVATADESKIPQILQIIGAKITDVRQDASDLTKAYEALGQISKISQNRWEEINKLFERGLQNIQNNDSSKKTAYRMQGKIEELKSSISLGQRVGKTENNPFGFKKIDSIQPEEICILYLGGDGTQTDKQANGYLSSTQKLLENNLSPEDLSKVSLYAPVYNFGAWDDRFLVFNGNLARTKLMQDYHRNIKISQTLNEDTLHPRYIDQLFKQAFLPRISDQNGQKLSTDKACRNIRKLNIVAHCHGAYTFLKLEEKMQQKMAELGYSAQDRAKIQRQLLCIAQSPYAPLGVSKSTMISFASVKDDEVSHYNNFETEIRRMSINSNVLFGYFPGKRGELLLVPSMGDGVDQHNFIGYDYNQQGLSTEGQALTIFIGNAIVNGVKHSIHDSDTPLPSTKELVCGPNKTAQRCFEQLRENGAKMWQIMASNTVARLKTKLVRNQSRNQR